MASKYLDSTVFLYAMLTQGPKSARAADVLRSLAEGDFDAVTSSLTLDEVLHKLSRVAGRPQAAQQVENLLSLPSLKVQAVSRKTMSAALGWFEKKKELGARDAVHVAAAFEAGATTILSDDADFDGIEGLPREGLG